MHYKKQGIIKSALAVIGCGIFFFSCTSMEEQKKEPTPTADTVSARIDLSHLNYQIKQDPNNPELYYQRAALHTDNKDVSSAEGDINRALNFDSTNCKYLTLQADLYFMQMNTRKARDILNTCLSNNDQYIEAYLKLAEIYLLVEQYKESIENIDKVLKIDKYHAKAYFMKGMNYKYSGDTAKAVSSLQTAVEQDAEYYDAYIQLGLLFAIARHPMAEAYYNNALRIKPNSREALYNKGMYLQENGKPEAAIAVYEQMVSVHPQDPVGYYNMGYVYMSFLSDFNKGAELFSKAISLHPDYYEAFYNRGLCFELAGDSKKAEEEYRKSLKIKPDFTLAAKGLSRVVD